MDWDHLVAFGEAFFFSLLFSSADRILFILLDDGMKDWNT